MSRDARLAKLREDMAKVSALKQVLKECCMIFEFDAKLRVFRHYGMPHPLEKDLPYREWKALKERYRMETGNAL